MATITTTVIPFSAADLNRPGAGVENWNGQDYADVPASGNRAVRTNYYFRFVWADIEKQTQGNYVWTRFDQEANRAFATGAKFSFGIFMVNDSDNFLAEEFFNNTSARYPKYVHDRMQTESVKDYVTNSQWIPAWNSTFMLDRYAALLVAIREHIIAKGWQDRIGYIDIRGYGQWGEWHSVGFGDPVSSMPNGIRPTVATYKRIADAHVAAFPDWQLVMMLAALDAEWLNNTLTPKEVTDYMLKLRNNVGLLGIRRDQWGARGNNPYVNDYLQNNNRNWNGGPAFKIAIMDRYKFAPFVGEPIGPGADLSGLEQEVIDYRATSFANGNYTKGSTSDNFVRAASKRAGYRLQIEGGSYSVNGNVVDTTLNWRNAGIAPTYENWDATFLLKTGNGSVAAQATGVFKPKLFLPSTSSTAVNEDLTFSASAGNYTLAVKLTDPKGYRQPMPLYISGVQSDGSYNLGNVTIGGTTPNQPPTANAGVDQSITMPTNSITLNGAGTDTDGSIASYLWTKVTTLAGTVTNPNSANTTVTGLAQGTHTFTLTVTDNQGATTTDNINIVVNPAVPVNQPPVANAGVDKAITLPVNSVTLNGAGSDADGSVTDFLWTKLSGPSGGVITTPTATTTNVTGLTQGTYIYQLRVTDNQGATSVDRINVTVNSQIPNVLPTANAGADKEVTLPTNSVQLTGSAADGDGTVISTVWTKVGGPAGGGLTNGDTLTPNVTDLLEGTYIYRLVVTDNRGGQAADNINVVVKPQPGTIKTIVNVTVLYSDGSTQVIS